MLSKFKRKIGSILMRLIFPHSEISMEKRFIKEAYHFYLFLSKYNASHHTDEDMEKMQYTLLRENHVIEKGMSMRNPRKGFGQKKVASLLNRLQKYFELYSDRDKDFLKYPLSTIKQYIEYTEANGIKVDGIKSEFNKLSEHFKPSEIQSKAGIQDVSKESILARCNSNFESLLFSRHSIRYFSKEPVEKNVIIKALELAQRTPSACNRQGWKTHVFTDDKSVDLMNWQGGCHGFENELRYSILVTANLKAFLYYEVHQAYVDGGLYAMNLINALHSLGLGCIPLSCGFEYEKLQGLEKFGIPENEVPIVIIAFGNLQDKFRVAVSTRKDINLTNTFH